MSEEYWESEWKSNALLQPTNFAKRALKFLKEESCSTLLDLGCGDGRDAIFFAKQGYTVTAIDYSKKGIEKLKKRADEQAVKLAARKMDLRRLKFPPNSFDVIYAHVSLHYFDDKTTARIFDKLHSLLTENGVIFIKCKSVDDTRYGLGQPIEENYFAQECNKRYFTKQYMQEKLQKYTIVRIRRSSSVHHNNYRSSFIEAIARR